MDDPQPPAPEPCRPKLTEAARAAAEARRAREAAALRENLRRRKTQARAREAPPPSGRDTS